MKDALYYVKLDEKKVKCVLCPKNCIILDFKRGDCGVRENQAGKLKSLVYGKAVSRNIDPIEKKPLFHFLPGSASYSIGTVGCNMHCRHCQNFEISQAKPEDFSLSDCEPEQIVDDAIANGCKSIAYTYIEPTVFYEYMIDTAKLAKKNGLKNVIVSNGFINPEPLKKLCSFIDGANIDLKAFDNQFYQNVSSAWLDPVLDTLKTLKKRNVWLEITNLIIPGLNDELSEIKKMCHWILENLSNDVPIHFSAFHPMYKMLDRGRTSNEVILKVREIALQVGLNYVYTGNIHVLDGENTVCPKCGKTVVKRNGFFVLENKLEGSYCNCNQKIPGVFN